MDQLRLCCRLFLSPWYLFIPYTIALGEALMCVPKIEFQERHNGKDKPTADLPDRSACKRTNIWKSKGISEEHMVNILIGLYVTGSLEHILLLTGQLSKVIVGRDPWSYYRLW